MTEQNDATPVSEAGGESDMWSPKLEAIRLLKAEDTRQLQILELLETIREQVRLGVKPEHRPDGLMKNLQTAVYGLRGRMPLLNDAAIMALLQALAKPASSPAGGGVVQTLIDKTEKLIEAADDMGWSCNSSSADQAIREAKDAVRAALSQSTSPDNDPTASGETVGSFRDRGPVATNPPGRGGRDQNSTSGEAGE